MLLSIGKQLLHLTNEWKYFHPSIYGSTLTHKVYWKHSRRQALQNKNKPCTLLNSSHYFVAKCLGCMQQKKFPVALAATLSTWQTEMDTPLGNYSMGNNY